MDNNEIVKKYLEELSSTGFIYEASFLNKNSGSFNLSGLSLYDEMPNVTSLILLESNARPETKEDTKFLIVEVYENATLEGHKFGVPSISYVHDSLADKSFSCYMINDDNLSLYSNVIDAVSDAIKKFELDNYQRIMSNDYVEDNVNDFVTEEGFDRDITSLMIAQAVLKSFNLPNNSLFETSLDIDTPKLTVNCPKYSSWTDIIDTGAKGNVHEQIEDFLNDNYTRYIQESIGLSKIYLEADLKVSKKNKIKPS